MSGLWVKHEKFGTRSIYKYSEGENYRAALKGHSPLWVSNNDLNELKKYISNFDAEKTKERAEKFGTTKATLGVAIDSYLKFKHDKNKEKAYRPDHTYARHIINFFGYGRRIDSISLKEMRDFFDNSERIGKTMTSTKIQVKGFLSSLNKHCEEMKIYTGWSWLANIKYKKADCLFENAAKRFQFDDLLMFLNAVDKSSKWYTIYRLFAAYGFRPKEIKDLRRSNWNSSERSIHVQFQKITKYRERKIYVTEELAKEIDTILSGHNNDNIFCTNGENNLGINAIFHNFKDTLEKTNIDKDKYSPYSFRKFAARNLYLKYRDLPRVLHMLGHSISVANVYHYFDINEETVDKERIWWEFPSENNKKENETKVDLIEQLKALPKEERIKLLAELLA
jgi:integrase